MKKEKRRVDDAGLKLVENSREDRAAVLTAQDVDCKLFELEIRRYEAETARRKVYEEEKTKRLDSFLIFIPKVLPIVALILAISYFPEALPSVLSIALLKLLSLSRWFQTLTK